MSLNKTPLWQKHKDLGAKMVEFSGWSMPLSYSSILGEHKVVRNKVGLFDVSHMGQVEVKGKGARVFLSRLLPNDVMGAKSEQATYSVMLNDEGGIIDDLFLYCVSDVRFFLCVNAGAISRTLKWIEKQAESFDNVTIENLSRDYGMLAIQGPKAEYLLQRVVKIPLQKLGHHHFTTAMIDEYNVIVSRTGYTGEDGFEIYCKWRETPELWDILVNNGKPYGLKPIGLGARDTLRLEMRYPLHGSDISEKTNPLEAGLGWVVDFDKEGGFIGKEALARIKDEGLTKRLVGIEFTERGIPRTGYKVFSGEDEVGEFTSGAISPTLNKGIGLAYVDRAYAVAETILSVEIRGKRIKGRVIKGSFVAGGLKTTEATATEVALSQETTQESTEVSPAQEAPQKTTKVAEVAATNELLKLPEEAENEKNDASKNAQHKT